MGLLIVREMYDEFLPTNKLILDKTRPSSLRFFFQSCARLIKGKNKPKFTECVKEFIPESLDHNPQRNLNLSTKSLGNGVQSLPILRTR